MEFKKGQLVEIKPTEDNLFHIRPNKDGKLTGKIIKNKAWCIGGMIKDPVHVLINRKYFLAGKSDTSIRAIDRSELTAL